MDEKRLKRVLHQFIKGRYQGIERQKKRVRILKAKMRQCGVPSDKADSALLPYMHSLNSAQNGSAEEIFNYITNEEEQSNE